MASKTFAHLDQLADRLLSEGKTPQATYWAVMVEYPDADPTTVAERVVAAAALR